MSYSEQLGENFIAAYPGAEGTAKAGQKKAQKDA
jgi:hypothetical protein